jgi:hypothetical protein
MQQPREIHIAWRMVAWAKAFKLKLQSSLRRFYQLPLPTRVFPEAVGWGSSFTSSSDGEGALVIFFPQLSVLTVFGSRPSETGKQPAIAASGGFSCGSHLTRSNAGIGLRW